MRCRRPSHAAGPAATRSAARFLSEPGSSASPPMSASMPSIRALRQSRVPDRLSAAASETDGRRPPHRARAGVTLGAGPGRVWGRTLKIWRLRPDSYLVSAVLTVLALRVYLAAAHYPQLGGNGLHIAHVLWGGLLMVVAIGMLLSLLTWTWQITGAVIGGVGFGLFIDELGKFLTSDNNYFFKPTASLVYAIFIVLFLTARELRHFRKLTARENLVNAIEASKQLALGPISNVIRNHALAWLDASDSSHPLTPFLHRQFELDRKSVV